MAKSRKRKASGDADSNDPPRHDRNAFEQLKFIREEIRFEHTLLGHRISWLLTSQTFLLSAFCLSFYKVLLVYPVFGFAHIFLPFYVLPVFGCLASFWMFQPVAEAVRRIEIERGILYEKGKPWESMLHFLRPGPGQTAHNLSLLYAKRLPRLCASLWIALAIFSQVLLCVSGHPHFVPPADGAVSQKVNTTPTFLSQRSGIE